MSVHLSGDLSPQYHAIDAEIPVIAVTHWNESCKLQIIQNKREERKISFGGK